MNLPNEIWKEYKIYWKYFLKILTLIPVTLFFSLSIFWPIFPGLTLVLLTIMILSIATESQFADKRILGIVFIISFFGLMGSLSPKGIGMPFIAIAITVIMLLVVLIVEIWSAKNVLSLSVIDEDIDNLKASFGNYIKSNKKQYQFRSSRMNTWLLVNSKFRIKIKVDPKTKENLIVSIINYKELSDLNEMILFIENGLNTS